MTLTLIDERELIDGSQTIIRLYVLNADACIVEAENHNGRTSTLVDPSEAGYAFRHPFSREEWLDYPTRATMKSVITEAEYRAIHTSELGA